jgi:hypothetical protein
MNFKRHFAILGVLIALFVVASMASASPAAPGAPTLRWRATGNPAVSEIIADGITDGGVAGNGAISWDVYFRLPASVPEPYPSIAITPGPAWTAMTNCTFATAVTAGLAGQGGTGTNGYFINGFCTTGVPPNPVVGNNVLVATVTLSGCPANGFVMDLDSGDDAFGAPVTAIVDRNNSAYNPSDGELTDGGACGNPTAVTLSNVSAGPVAPIGNALYLAAAGSIALLGAAGLALRGIRKH